MSDFLEKYQEEFIINQGLVKAVGVSEERQRELEEMFKGLPAFREEEFLKEHNVTYDYNSKKFYNKVPHELTNQELDRYIAMKSLDILKDNNKKITIIRNILIFFFIIAIFPMLFTFFSLFN